MRILLFVSQLSAGGAEQVAILLSKGFVSLGCEVAIATARSQGEFLDRVDDVCQVINLNSGKPIKALKALANRIDGVDPDLVICFGFTPGIAASLSKIIFGWKCPIVVRNENNLRLEWSLATPLNRLIGPLLSRWVARRNKVIAVSHDLSKATEEYLDVPAGSICTILNPALDDCSRPQKFSTDHLHPWLHDGMTPTFVGVGRLEQQKGFDVLIAAFSRVLESSNARLVIFGQGSLRDNLQNQVNSLNIAKHVVLAGFTNFPIEQMRASHAFVLSSRFEGFGLVLVEALWAGTKIISTNCDFGPTELLDNGRYGALLPVDDTQALANAMLQSLQAPWPAERPSEEWFKQFTATEAARQHLTLFESLRSKPQQLEKCPQRRQ